MKIEIWNIPNVEPTSNCCCSSNSNLISSSKIGDLRKLSIDVLRCGGFVLIYFSSIALSSLEKVKEAPRYILNDLCFFNICQTTLIIESFEIWIASQMYLPLIKSCKFYLYLIWKTSLKSCNFKWFCLNGISLSSNFLLIYLRLSLNDVYVFVWLKVFFLITLSRHP